jgi:hypothetical protein
VNRYKQDNIDKKIVECLQQMRVPWSSYNLYRFGQDVSSAKPVIIIYLSKPKSRLSRTQLQNALETKIDIEFVEEAIKLSMDRRGYNRNPSYLGSGGHQQNQSSTSHYRHGSSSMPGGPAGHFDPRFVQPSDPTPFSPQLRSRPLPGQGPDPPPEHPAIPEEKGIKFPIEPVTLGAPSGQAVVGTIGGFVSINNKIAALTNGHLVKGEIIGKHSLYRCPAKSLT